MEQPDKKQQALDSISHLSKHEQAKTLLAAMVLCRRVNEPIGLDDPRLPEVKEYVQSEINRAYGKKENTNTKAHESE